MRLHAREWKELPLAPAEREPCKENVNETEQIAS
jgi:hypothetical protein